MWRCLSHFERTEVRRPPLKTIRDAWKDGMPLSTAADPGFKRKSNDSAL